MSTTFDRAIFGPVNPDAPCLDNAGAPYWVDDHNQPLTWAEAFSLWDWQTEHPWTPPTDQTIWQPNLLSVTGFDVVGVIGVENGWGV